MGLLCRRTDVTETIADDRPYRESNHPALYYQDMIGDTRRMARYRAAIEAVVRPGDVVADLGTGLGVLAMMAVQAGAARVYGAATLEDIDFEAPLPERGYEREVNLEVIAEGEMQGFVGYFACELAPGISLDNYPCYSGCHWVNWHWPVTPVQRVLPGQRIHGLLTTPERTVASCWSWAWSLD
jgi:hypothetical protein